MTFTYTGDPGSSDRDHIRFLIGDKKQTKQSVTDEEITFLLQQHGDDVTLAAAAAADALANTYSGMAATSKSIGDLSISYEHGETAGRYQKLAARLRASMAGVGGPVFADQTAQFSIGMMDNDE